MGQVALDRQLAHLWEALPYVKRFRHAIDGGAHHGVWTRAMAEKFQFVTAFEPAPDNFEVLRESVASCKNVNIWMRALGDENCQMTIPNMEFKSSTRYVVKDPAGQGYMESLDSHLSEYENFMDVDFLKLDCEGADVLVLLGAQETIATCRPVILVEDKGLGPSRYGSPSVEDVLTPWDYRKLWHHKPDSLWVPK